MRSVQFVKYVEFDSLENVYKSALTLGDVDNDGHQELVVGSLDGDLYIFKERKRIQTITGLGMITAVGVGNIFNCGSNALVVIGGDGWCYIYLCLSRNLDEKEPCVKLEPVHVQRIPANTKVLLMDDIDNDGNIELVLGLTDRVVRCYRWTQNISGGKLICLNKWECADQIGNITMNYDSAQQPCLLISQPGGTFMRVRCRTKEQGESDKMIVDYQPLTSRRMRNVGISSEILGNIVLSKENRLNSKGTPYVVATLDGTLMFVQDEEIQWSIQVDHQLFALSKMDVTGNGSDKVITCSWEGHTYILDHERNSIQFQMDEPVSAFCSGLYTVDASKLPTPCLVYLTFSNKIYVYYDIHFPSIVTTNLTQYMQEKEQNEKTNSLREQLLGFTEDKDSRKLISWCLYGKHNFR